jgi:nucleotide-binding universal stress UspA family protein
MVEYKNILFCTDFSEDAEIAFLHAVDLARKHDAKLHIFHVAHSSYRYSRQLVDEYLPEGATEGQAIFDQELEKRAVKALKDTYQSRVSDVKDCVFVIKSGAPDVEIIHYAKKNNVDLIVMGALGKSDQDRLVHGSTVANVSRYAHCHVMAIRNPAKQFVLPGSLY